jgi:hypothetical protein
MAITAAAMQAALGTNPNDARVIHHIMPNTTLQRWYIVGNLDAVGRARWVTTTASDNAATQAAAALVALLA